jgi:hypothetical protein
MILSGVEFQSKTTPIILGHRSAAITEAYAELDQQKAMEAIVRVGNKPCCMQQLSTGRGLSLVIAVNYAEIIFVLYATKRKTSGSGAEPQESQQQTILPIKSDNIIIEYLPIDTFYKKYDFRYDVLERSEKA